MSTWLIFCRMVGDRWVIPPLADLKQYKMVVATLSTARNLLFSGLPKDHFTHIFIDEAAQVKMHFSLPSSLPPSLSPSLPLSLSLSLPPSPSLSPPPSLPLSLPLCTSVACHAWLSVCLHHYNCCQNLYSLLGICSVGICGSDSILLVSYWKVWWWW